MGTEVLTEQSRSQGVKLTPQLHLVQRLRMRAAVFLILLYVFKTLIKTALQFYLYKLRMQWTFAFEKCGIYQRKLNHMSWKSKPSYQLLLLLYPLSKKDRNFESCKITNTLCNYKHDYPSLDGFVITTWSSTLETKLFVHTHISPMLRN